MILHVLKLKILRPILCFVAQLSGFDVMVKLSEKSNLSFKKEMNMSSVIDQGKVSFI